MASKSHYQQSVAKTIKAPGIPDYLVLHDDSPEREEDEGDYLEPRQTKTRVGEPPRTEVQTGHGEAETLTDSEDLDVGEYLTTSPGECRSPGEHCRLSEHRRPGEHRRPLPSVPSQTYEEIQMYDVIQDTHTGAGESPSLALPPPTSTNSRSRAGRKPMVIVGAVTTALVFIISVVVVTYFFIPRDSKPEIPTQQPTATMVSNRIMINQGTTGTLRCIVTGSPAPNITWSKVNAELGSNHQVEGSVLLILEAKPEDSGSYICRADNIAGAAEASAIVEVERHEPPRIEIYPETTTIIPPGGSALFECRVTGGVPLPETSWVRANNEQFTANTLEDRQGNLRFKNVTGDEHGIYICTASNVAGSVTATATLIIQGVPDYSQVSHVKTYTNSESGQYQSLSPSGMAVTQNDHIWICDYFDEKILVLDNQLQPVSEIRTDGQQPYDATVSSGLVYVTMRNTHQIHVYNENRTLLSVLGSEGSGLGQFKYPKGITSVGNKVYICDKDNNRIQVYENGTWSQFGQGEFGVGLVYIAVSSNDSRLAVVDWYDDNLYIFNRSHHVTHKFNLTQPPLNIASRGVTYDQDNNLIICDLVGHSLVVLDQDYNIISRIGVQVLSSPRVVAWTQSGNLLVTDSEQDAVHLFRVPYRSRP